LIIFTEVPEFVTAGDHEIIAAKELLKNNYIKVEPSIICHDGESIQVCIRISEKTIGYIFINKIS